mgnify:CR=1 FL=1
MKDLDYYYMPLYTSTQLFILDAEVITIAIVYLAMIILIGVNSWLFLWKLKEINNPHSVVFYILSLMICVCRVVNLVYSYIGYAL